MNGRTSQPSVALLRLYRSDAADPVPVVCVHPVSGSAMCYAGLGERLAAPVAVYGVQDLGTPPAEVHSIVELAEAYVIQLEDAELEQPVVVGWSFGALVALEMVRAAPTFGPAVLVDPPVIRAGGVPLRPRLAAQLGDLAELARRYAHDEEWASGGEGRYVVGEALARAGLPRGLVDLGSAALTSYVELHGAHYRAQFAHRIPPFEGTAVILVCDSTRELHGSAYLKEWLRVLGPDAVVRPIAGKHEDVFEDPESLGDVANVLSDVCSNRQSRLEQAGSPGVTVSARKVHR